MLDSILCFLFSQSVPTHLSLDPVQMFRLLRPKSNPDSDFEDVTPIVSFSDSPSDTPSESDHVTVARFDVPVGGVTDIASSLAVQPVQPSLRTHPKRKFGTRDRAFQNEWYLNRNWLECSQTVDAVFCYCCRDFRTSNSSEQWTVKGSSNWKNATEEGKGLKAHEVSIVHLDAAAKWSAFKETKRSGSIALKIKAISRQNILDNRHYLKTVTQVVGLSQYRISL